MAKRLFDLMFALPCLVVAAPAILVIAIFVKLDSSDPVLYVPKMVGKDSKLFWNVSSTLRQLQQFSI